MDKSHVEAWKAITEFTKVIISLSTSILTILVGYMTLNSVEISLRNLISPVCLVFAIFLSLYGFGRAIPPIETGSHNRTAILFSNLSVLALTAGVCTILMISVNLKQPVNDVLKVSEQKSPPLSCDLLTEKCKQVNIQGDVYVLTFPLKEKTVIVQDRKKSSGNAGNTPNKHIKKNASRLCTRK